MSKPREKWWGYVKACLREYPELSGKVETLKGQRRREYEAVRAALSETEALPDGAARRRLVELVFFRQSHTLRGAAIRCCVSDATARRWHQKFIKLTASYLGLLD